MSPIYIVKPQRIMTVKQFLGITVPIAAAGAIALIFVCIAVG